MAPPIEDILRKYIELRDRKTEMAKRQAEEVAPLNDAMGKIENYFLHQMNTLGVDQLKSKEVGTVFKTTSTSCQMQDSLSFKGFVFAPVAEGIVNYLKSTGYGIRDIDAEAISNIIRDLPKWDMIDFRAGKKGIMEYVAVEEAAVPGIAINSIASVSVRRA